MITLKPSQLVASLERQDTLFAISQEMHEHCTQVFGYRDAYFVLGMLAGDFLQHFPQEKAFPAPGTNKFQVCRVHMNAKAFDFDLFAVTSNEIYFPEYDGKAKKQVIFYSREELKDVLDLPPTYSKGFAHDGQNVRKQQ
jgi:hypothetical protein